MRTYAQYCPIVRAVEVLGERWTLLIVREMLNGAGRFNELSRGLPGDVSVCYADPGFEVDALLRSDLATLYRMWEGEIELLDAVKAGSIELTGPRWITRGLPRWLQLSPVAPYVRAARA